MMYNLYVPAPGQTTHIFPESAIVGEVEGSSISVHFEGSDQMTFETRIIHAAGRRMQRYPTVALGLFPIEALVKVGTVEHSPLLRSWVIQELTDEAALRAWAPVIPPVGGGDEIMQRALGLIWSDLDMSEQAKVLAQVKAGGDMKTLLLAAGKQKIENA